MCWLRRTEGQLKMPAPTVYWRERDWQAISDTASYLIVREGGREGLHTPSDQRNSAIVNSFHVPACYTCILANIEVFKVI